MAHITLADCTLIARAFVSARRAQYCRERIHGGGNEGVVGPDTALVAGENPGVHEDLEVVGDGGLGQAQGLGQVADAGFASFMRGDHGDQPQPGGVGERFEEPGEVGGLAGADRFAQQRCTAGVCQGRPGLDVEDR